MTRKRQSASDVARAVLELDGSGLFDAEWYLRHDKRGADEAGDPLVRFCNGGWQSGLWPNFHFQTDWYLERNPDVAARGINPLLHYHLVGEADDRDPAPHFDVAWYRRTYGIGRGQPCLSHFLARRAGDQTSPNAHFDAAWYDRRYDRRCDVAGDAYEHFVRFGAARLHSRNEEEDIIARSGLFDAVFYRARHDIGAVADHELIGHFCHGGWQSGLHPNEFFDPRHYLDRNPDVREAGVNPLLHYIAHGAREDRTTSDRLDPAQYRVLHQLGPGASVIVECLQRSRRQHALVGMMRDPAIADGVVDHEARAVIRESDLFDENYYLINYPDVRQSGMDPFDHFHRFGMAEGRRPNPYFETDWYRHTYLAGRNDANPLLHYILEGERAGNRPIVYFEPAWYAESYGIHASLSPLLHYLHNRRSQNFSPNRFFDIAYYLDHYGSAVGGNRDLFAHYLREGITRDVNPNPQFESRAYRERWMTAPTPYRATPGAEIHEKVKRERLNPLVHYMLATFQAGVTPPAAV
jgi:hypothetical protein